MPRESESINTHYYEILKNYYKYMSRGELLIDSLFPMGISLILFTFFYFFEPSTTNILNSILDINNISLAVIAILAGFNTTSLAIIASSNKEVLKNIFNRKSNDGKSNILEQTVSFFTFAILFQISTLVIGTIIAVGSNNIVNLYIFFGFTVHPYAKIATAFVGFIWLSIIIYALFISLRNVTLLYRYILFLAKN